MFSLMGCVVIGVVTSLVGINVIEDDKFNLKNTLILFSLTILWCLFCRVIGVK